jgi:hypothetical protein
VKPLELALKYMEIFYSGKKLERLADILAEDLLFTGPFYTFNSAEDYIKSLKNDPPKGMKYEIIKSFEDESSACLIYKFQKKNISTTMAQFFEVKDEKISKINLIFDTKAFAQ